MIIKKCKFCKKKFESFKSRKRNFCSRKCFSKLNPGTFKKGHKWVGKLKNSGIRKHSSGYIEIYSPNHPYKSVRKAVLQHRLVIEKSIGRFLKPNERVHHINGIKNDNRIKNLKLFKNQSDHIKYEYKNVPKFKKTLKKHFFKKGQVSPFKGKKHTKEAKEKMCKLK